MSRLDALLRPHPLPELRVRSFIIVSVPLFHATTPRASATITTQTSSISSLLPIRYQGSTHLSSRPVSLTRPFFRSRTSHIKAHIVQRSIHQMFLQSTYPLLWPISPDAFPIGTPRHAAGSHAPDIRSPLSAPRCPVRPITARIPSSPASDRQSFNGNSFI